MQRSLYIVAQYCIGAAYLQWYTRLYNQKRRFKLHPRKQLTTDIRQAHNMFFFPIFYTLCLISFYHWRVGYTIYDLLGQMFKDLVSYYGHHNDRRSCRGLFGSPPEILRPAPQGLLGHLLYASKLPQRKRIHTWTNSFPTFYRNDICKQALLEQHLTSLHPTHTQTNRDIQTSNSSSTEATTADYFGDGWAS